MRLANVYVAGYRRFEVGQNLNISTKLTAIVGPNEAGKTSLLKAIASVDNDDAIRVADHTNHSTITPEIKLSFFLDNDDISAASLGEPSWLDVVKRTDGKRRYAVRPYPNRDVGARDAAARALRSLSRATRIVADLESETDFTTTKFESVMGGLAHSKRFDDGFIVSLQELSDLIDPDQNGVEEKPVLTTARDRLRELVDFERLHDPHQFAINTLRGRVPTILEFDEEYRNLDIPFDLAYYGHPEPTARRTPTRPLAEIIRLSGLELDKIKNAAVNRNEAVKMGLLQAANERLAKICREVWKQSDAALQIIINGTLLDILVHHADGFAVEEQYSEYSGRSDGYKQFVTVQLFTMIEKADQSIVLIDEIEQHLHYDAQADLIQLLQNEPSIGSVVYTTHSAGGLPEDLGQGVRSVRWDSNRRKVSVIENKFWRQNDDAGFRPLLFGMGATTFAFFPTRRALVAEGATEMLLMPTMMREASALGSLDFQVVHGLSNINPTGLPMLDIDENRVSYFVDADSGAHNIIRLLEKAGVSDDKIFSIKQIDNSLITLEDLIDPDTWLYAINKYIKMFGSSNGLKPITNAPDVGRINSLPKIMRKEKVAIAYNVIDEVQRNPNRRVLAANYKTGLYSLFRNVRSALKLDTIACDSGPTRE